MGYTMKHFNFITLAILITFSNIALLQADSDVSEIKPASAPVTEVEQPPVTAPQALNQPTAPSPLQVNNVPADVSKKSIIQKKQDTEATPPDRTEKNEIIAPKVQSSPQTTTKTESKEVKPTTTENAKTPEIVPVKPVTENPSPPLEKKLEEPTKSKETQAQSPTPEIKSDAKPATPETPAVSEVVTSPTPPEKKTEDKPVSETPATNTVEKTEEKKSDVANSVTNTPSPLPPAQQPASAPTVNLKPTPSTPEKPEAKKEGDQKSSSEYSFVAPDKLFNAKGYKLDNGLQIVVFENKRAPVVTHMMWYRVGSADEVEGKSGIAHFLEHLMFKGQKDLKPGQFSKIIRSLGGHDNAFTSYDYTAYYQSVAKEHLETIMIMESGRMRDLNTPPEEFTSENKVIQEERRQRTDNDPRAQMAEQINAALFPNHRYGVPVIGWMHEIEKLTLDDAKTFYDRYYTPNNAILVVSGDVTGERVLELAKKTYGVFPSHDIPERMRSASPEFIANQEITLTHATIKEPAFMRTYRVPSFRQNSTESLALQVLQQILSGGSSSILYDTLVTEKKLAIDTSFSYDPNTWDDATFDFYAAHTLKISADKVKNAFEEELRNLIKKGIEDDVLADAKRTLQAQSIYALDSVEGPAMILGRSLITGMSLDDIEGWAKSIGTVTKEQVQAVAQKYLNPDSPYKYPPVNGYLKPVDNQ